MDLRETVLSRVASLIETQTPIEIEDEKQIEGPFEKSTELAVQKDFEKEVSTTVSKCSSLCSFIHNEVAIAIEKEAFSGKRFVSITPAVFLNFIATFANILCRCGST